MPKLQLQNSELAFSEGDVITFDEGLVGLPHLRRMVVVSQPEIEPFLWLTSVEDASTTFLVLEPGAKFEQYAPTLPPQIRARLGLKAAEEPLWLAIVRITPEWQDSTVNLRAPLAIAPHAMRGAQFVLTESGYRVNEPLAVN